MKPVQDQRLEIEAAVQAAAVAVDAARASGDAHALAAIAALEGADRNRTNFYRSLNTEPYRNTDFWGNPRR